jgi:hypothetical protein
MYCSTCGQQIAEHLNYCNSCGARIEKNPLVISNSSSSQLAKPLAITVMMGFVGFIAVLKIILDNPRLDIPAVVLIVIAYLAALTIISAMMIGHMWKTSGDIRVHAKKPNIDSDEYAPPRSFRGSNTHQLDEPVHQPIGSVTDNTTRTLDEVLVERR